MNKLALTTFVTCALLTGSIAGARISDDLLEALPSPINFLERSKRAGADLEQGLFGYLKSECPQLKSHRDQYQKHGCEIPDLGRQYSNLLSKFKRGENGVATLAKLPTKPWDLSVLISGNFMFFQTEDSATEGRDLLIELFVLRTRILSAIENQYQNALNTIPKPISPEQVMLAPFMRAYFLTSTPLGALSEVFRSIQCGIDERSCEIEKRIWGNICNLAVEVNDAAFADMERRYTIIGNDETSPDLARTKLIKDLADYIEQGHFDRDLLASKLTELESLAPSQSSNEDYAKLTVSVLTYAEMKRLMSLKFNCFAYVDDLSERTKTNYRNQIPFKYWTELAPHLLGEVCRFRAQTKSYDEFYKSDLQTKLLEDKDKWLASNPETADLYERWVHENMFG